MTTFKVGDRVRLVPQEDSPLLGGGWGAVIGDYLEDQGTLMEFCYGDCLIKWDSDGEDWLYRPSELKRMPLGILDRGLSDNVKL